MTKLRGFISYAQEDEPYFKLLKEGLRKHGKHSKIIDSDLWHDEKILPGSLWHDSIQEQVQDCDFAVFLVSSNFLASEYIEEHEFKNFLKRQEKEGFLFFPLLINACDFSYWEHLAARQFFMPDGKDYGCSDIRGHFTFGDLVQHNIRTGEILPNTNRERYLMNLVKKIEEALSEYQKKKEVKNIIPNSKYFKISHISTIQPEDFLNIRADPNQGFRPFYLDRPYLDKRLKYNQQQNRHSIIVGKPLDGKSRSVFELCKNLAGEDILMLFPEPIDIKMDDFEIPETKTNLILFFDDFDQFLKFEHLEKALKKPCCIKIFGLLQHAEKIKFLK